nr:hypothetical protein [Tanacetum cinerariifolium]GEX82699.1 hypothetical protein [Tanacetum cinerariifolium]
MKEEKDAVKRIKGEALKEKDDPGAFIFPIRKEEMKKIDKEITMINHTQAEAMRKLSNVLCQVRVTTIIAKFLILDIPIDRYAPIVVGRGFLYTMAKSDSDDEEEYMIKRSSALDKPDARYLVAGERGGDDGGSGDVSHGRDGAGSATALVDGGVVGEVVLMVVTVDRVKMVMMDLWWGGWTSSDKPNAPYLVASERGGDGGGCGDGSHGGDGAGCERVTREGGAVVVGDDVGGGSGRRLAGGGAEKMEEGGGRDV